MAKDRTGPKRLKGPYRILESYGRGASYRLVLVADKWKEIIGRIEALKRFKRRQDFGEPTGTRINKAKYEGKMSTTRKTQYSVGKTTTKNTGIKPERSEVD